MKKIPKSFTKWAKKHFKGNIDKIDFYAEYDRSLTVEENKEYFRTKYKDFYIPTKKEIQEEIKNEIELNEYYRKEQIKEYEKKVLQNITFQSNNVDTSYFDTAKNLIKITAKGYANATLLIGEGGLGKTYLTLQTLHELGLKPMQDYIYFNTYTTPLALYKFLYEHKDKLIIFDDTEGIINDRKAVTILKAILWDVNGKRIVNYNTTSDKANDVPSVFEFEGKLIILCNKIPNEKDISMKALLSRTLFYRVNFTYNQKLEIIKKILESKKELNESEKKEIFKIIKDNTDITTINFNLRTLERLISYYKYDKSKAEELFKKTTYRDETLAVVSDIIRNLKHLTVNEQVKIFAELTGKSRRTFFNLKKKLKNRGLKI